MDSVSLQSLYTGSTPVGAFSAASDRASLLRSRRKEGSGLLRTASAEASGRQELSDALGRPARAAVSHRPTVDLATDVLSDRLAEHLG